MCTDGHCGRVTVTDDELCMGVGEAIALGSAALAAGGTAYASNQNNQQSAGNAYMANLTNMTMQAQNMQYNREEARDARAFQDRQGGIGRQFTADQAEYTRNFNSMEAEKARQFQERMSNTQYQRAIGDMKAAGLNPMLAYSQGGAGNVNGSAASVGASSAGSVGGAQASAGHAPSAVVPNYRAAEYGSLVTSALDAGQKIANIQQTEAQTGLIQSQTALSGQQARKIDDEIKLLVQQTQKTMHEASTENERKDLVVLQRATEYVRAQLENQKISESEAAEQLDKIRTKLAHYEVAGAKNTSDFEQSLSSVSGKAGIGAAGNAAGVAKTVMEVIKSLGGRK